MSLILLFSWIIGKEPFNKLAEIDQNVLCISTLMLSKFSIIAGECPVKLQYKQPNILIIATKNEEATSPFINLPQGDQNLS